MKVDVVMPEEYLGDVMGDLSSRRGHILGMEGRGTSQNVKANVPLAEMFGYATELRSMTSGRATYSMEFSHYADRCPETWRRPVCGARTSAELVRRRHWRRRSSSGPSLT